jgi:1-acyl-sn-glycerol-3-phosphate acyltransferase
MMTIRSLLFVTLLALTVLLYGSAILLTARLLSAHSRNRLGRQWAQVVLWLLKQVSGLDYRVQGLENLPDSPSVVLCKHQSAWETIALRVILPPEQTWVLKQELTRIPVFGAALKCFSPIAIDRSAGRQAMRQLLSEGRSHLERGNWVVVFPEGTRVMKGERKRFSIGGALLAKQTGATVVPIAHNAGVFWGRRALRKVPGCIDVVIGEPIFPGDRSAQEVNAAAEEWINRTVDALPATAGNARRT